MQSYFRFFMAILGLLAAIAFLEIPAHAVPGVLERPAMITARASKSVLLAVTSAGTRLVAVGERGIILFSDDNGTSWRQAKVPVSVTLTAVRFMTPRTGWALGHSGIVLHTEDGGETWIKQIDGRQAAQLVYDAVQAEAKTGKGKAEELEKRLAAAKQILEEGADKPFFDMYFENERSVFIVGAYNLMFHTEDGGKSWQSWQDHIENPKGLHLYGIRSSGTDLFVVGEQGLFLRSKDQGKTFASVRTPYAGTYFGLIAGKSGELVLYGMRGQAFWSGNRGATWEKIETGVSLSLTDGKELPDGALVLVSQEGVVLVSRDKGRSFRKITLQTSSSFEGVEQAADGSLILVGGRGVSRIPKPDLSASTSPTANGARK